MNRCLVFTCLALIASLGAGCRIPLPVTNDVGSDDGSAGERILVAHYFNWFQTPDARGGWRLWDWRGAGPNHDPERISPDGRRDIASVFYPQIGPYDSSRPEVMEYHLLLAKLAGIDAFVVDWYGLRHVDDRLIRPLMDKAASLGMRVGICFEDKAMFGYEYRPRTREEAVQNAISNFIYILKEYAPHPAYLRLEDRPVVVNFSWAEPDARISSQGFSAAEWRRILRAAREESAVYFVHDYHGHVRESYWAAADNVYPWLDVNGAVRDRYYREARDRMATGQIDSITTLVYPGFDNTGVWGWGSGPFVTPRDDGTLYRRFWDEALSFPVRLLQIATWNDFGEGATIEPTKEYGFSYLEITQEYAARWKGGAAPDSSLLRLPEQIFRLRVALRGKPDRTASQWLDDVVAALSAGDIHEARRRLAAVRP